MSVTPSYLVQLIDALTIGAFIFVIISLVAANGRLRSLVMMMAAIGIEVCFTFASRFWERGSWLFMGLHFAGRCIELAGIAAYLYRSRKE